MTVLLSTLGLHPALLKAADEAGYHDATPIQAAAIPPALAGRDVLGSAQTGSGKTVAFALPILQRLAAAPRPVPRRLQALVLVPTRELAVQVAEVMRGLAQHLAPPVKVAAVHGGVSINPQLMGLRGGADIVVATPGRLLDLVDHNAPLGLSTAGVLVLDEADRLLDGGFADELQRVLALLPGRRQNLFFSATFPPAVTALAQALLADPVRVALPTEATTAPDITQQALQVDAAKRTPLLRHLIEQHGWPRVLVFVATRYASDHVAEKLRRGGIAAAAFHADLSQGARAQVLADFHAGRLKVLVATDVAARGLDIVQLPVVINYDLPRAAADHLHRIGRTARAGASGLAISFVSASTEAHFRLIEKRQGQRVPRQQVPGFEPTEAAPPPSAPGGGIKGRRPNRKDKLREAAAASGNGGARG